MTRVHASDGALLGEYSKERRLYLPIQAVPKLVINAFLAAEDKNFYEHGGIDFSGMARAGVLYAQNYGSNRRPQGASTITQQVAKNFLLTNEVSFTRKIKEALLAMRIERAYSKDKILELYLNEIYLGLGAYGVAAASLVYFDKSVQRTDDRGSRLSGGVAEGAGDAASGAQPRPRDRAPQLRDRSPGGKRLDQAGRRRQGAQGSADRHQRAERRAHFAGEYFAEEVRRDIFERYGEKKLYEGGLSVRTTLDPKLQVMARKTLTDGLVKFDESAGLSRRDQKLDISRRLGRQARRRQVAVRYRAVADGGGAGDQRSVGAHRLSAGARTRRRGLQGTADRHHPARGGEMGEGRGRTDRAAGRRPRSARCSSRATSSMPSR